MNLIKVKSMEKDSWSGVENTFILSNVHLVICEDTNI